MVRVLVAVACLLAVTLSGCMGPFSSLGSDDPLLRPEAPALPPASQPSSSGSGSGGYDSWESGGFECFIETGRHHLFDQVRTYAKYDDRSDSGPTASPDDYREGRYPPYAVGFEDWVRITYINIGKEWQQNEGERLFGWLSPGIEVIEGNLSADAPFGDDILILEAKIRITGLPQEGRSTVSIWGFYHAGGNDGFCDGPLGYTPLV